MCYIPNVISIHRFWLTIILKVTLKLAIMKKKILSIAAILVVGFIVYKYFFEPKEEYYTDYTGDLTVVSEDGKIPNRVTVPQAWNDATRKDFWFTSQGADIMPYDWFTYLEQPNTTKLFRNADFLESLGYLPQKASLQNPSGLPIGFTITRYRENIPRGLGFNCAACHTNQLNYKGANILIEGAPTVANFAGFFKELVKSLDNTYQDDAKFDRFAKKVLKDYSSDKASALRKELEKVALANTERQLVNKLPEGYPKDFTSYGRIDAFGEIMNAGTAFALGDLSNKNVPDAPVSYPFLWGTHQSDVVQWNASAPNTPVIGPLVRNIGEVVGVFGSLKIEPGKIDGTNTYSSTVDYKGLGELETWIKNLRSPQWPEKYLPAMNIEKVARGERLYAKACASCHQVIPREKEGNLYIANKTLISELGTDPLAAWNIQNRTAKTLILDGKKESVLFGDTFGETTTAIKIPVNGVIGLVISNPIKALKAGLAPGENSGVSKDVATLEELVKENMGKRSMPNKDSLVYKGRPLNGIWATAPFLHNGSVPNLWELLTVPKNRIKEFQVGNREFDPINVGYITDTLKGPSIFRVLKKDRTIMKGNSNLGHSYGTLFTDKEKWDLIEYMKSL